MTDRECLNDNCQLPVLARGLCSKHYQEAKREGTLNQVAPKLHGPCQHCGGVIPPQRRYGAQFCSTTCKQAAADQAAREETRATHAKRVLACAWCRELVPPEKRIDARFCSVKCNTDWHNYQKAQTQRRATLAAREPCPVCGKPVPPSRRRNSIYCSQDCKTKGWMNASPKTRERQFDENLRRTYGLTTDGYNALLKAQGGVCAICGATESAGVSKSLHVDHCHGSKAIRGLLCTNCNRGLGLFKDDPARLRAAAEYLERHLASEPATA